MVYCAQKTWIGVPSQNIEVAFPGQIELKVNNEVYSGNLRGIKKKPGTTRPADVTDFVTKQPNYVNSVSVTAASQDKNSFGSGNKFVFVVYLVKNHSVNELVERVKRGKRIGLQTVLNDSELLSVQAMITSTNLCSASQS
jgi:E3 SUMO-protein ligase PIAS1